MMLIDVLFKIGDSVYLKTDTEQLERIVTGYSVRSSSISYGLSCGVSETWHHDFEITVDKNVSKMTGY